MILSFFLTAIILTVMDTLYLRFMKKYMINQIESVQKSKFQVNIFGFIMTYFFLVSGLYYFIINKRLGYKDGALLGFIIYGVYDLTNLASFKDWSYMFAILDIMWGTFLFGMTTFLVQTLLRIL